MSVNTPSSNDGDKNRHKRSCLAVIESDGLFDGRRRVRLPFSSSPTCQSSSHDTKTQLLDLKQSLASLLELPSTVNVSEMEIELYNSTRQAFQRLDRIDDIPSTCCRLRITTERMKSFVSLESSHDNSKSTSSQSHELLSLPWREFSSSIDLDGKLVLKEGKYSIAINEVSNSGLGTGTNIWDGAIALTKFLEFHDRGEGEDNARVRETKDELENSSKPTTMNDEVESRIQPLPNPAYSVRRKQILELGAGTGLVGIAAHVAFGAKEVVLTDLEYSLGNLRENLKANDCRLASVSEEAVSSSSQAGTIDAMVLDWFDLTTCDEVLRKRSSMTTTKLPTATNESVSTNTNQVDEWIPDIVLAADVVWVESLVRPLVQTLHRICTKSLSSPPLILLSYQRRSQAVEDVLFRTLDEFSFRTEDVTSPVVSTTSGAESKIRIYQITCTRSRVD